MERAAVLRRLRRSLWIPWGRNTISSPSCPLQQPPYCLLMKEMNSYGNGFPNRTPASPPYKVSFYSRLQQPLELPALLTTHLSVRGQSIENQSVIGKPR